MLQPLIVWKLALISDKTADDNRGYFSRNHMKKIVIVDDEIEICTELTELLKEAGYLPFSSYRGHDGYDLIVREKPDLVILDIALPDVDGTIVYEKIRKNPDLKNTRVLFLTALASGAPQEFAGVTRADYSIISKPVQFDFLHREIERLLDM